MSMLMLRRRALVEFHEVAIATDQPGSFSLSSETLSYVLPLLRRYGNLADADRRLTSVVDHRPSWCSVLRQSFSEHQCLTYRIGQHGLLILSVVSRYTHTYLLGKKISSMRGSGFH